MGGRCVGYLILSLDALGVGFTKQARKWRRIDLKSDRAHEEFVVRNTGNGREYFKNVGEIRAVPIVGFVREPVINVCHMGAHNRAKNGGGDVVAANAHPLGRDTARTKMAER